MKKHVRRRAFLLTTFVIAAASLLSAKAFCRCRQPLGAGRWRLPDLVGHLNDQGVHLRVVPSRADGKWDDTIFLTIDSGATWESFQRKNLNPERIGQWQGSVWAHRIGENTDVEGRLLAWQGHGCRVANFLLFGDAVLIERIRGAVPSRASGGLTSPGGANNRGD